MEYIVKIGNGNDNDNGENEYLLSGSLRDVKRIAINKAIFKSKLFNMDIQYSIELYNSNIVYNSMVKLGVK